MSPPPTSGPTATANPIVAPQIPNAVPRSRPWNSCAISASEVANMTAPPIPCAPRARFRNSGLVASAQVSDEAVNRTRPPAKTSRRPRMSPSEPAVSSSDASISAYASITHCRSEKLECRSFWMSGRATFTIVMSSRSMNVAVQAASRVHHFRSILVAFPVRAVPYQPSQCAIVSSGLRLAGLNSSPIVYATGSSAACMISS